MPATGPHEQRDLDVQRRRHPGRQRGEMVKDELISFEDLRFTIPYFCQSFLRWGIPGIGFLVRGEDRPKLLETRDSTDLLFENIFFKGTF